MYPPHWRPYLRKPHAVVTGPTYHALDVSEHTMMENTEAWIVASKETGLELNADKTSTWSCLEIRTQDEVTVKNLDTMSL
jgi:hypothetical protein